MANHTLFTGTHARGGSLLFVWLLLQGALVGASFTHLAKRAYGQFPKFAADFDGRVAKGKYLRSLFALTDAEAKAKNGQSVASPYQQTEDYIQWGWRRGEVIWGPWVTIETIASNLDIGEASELSDETRMPSYSNILYDLLDDPVHPVHEAGSAIFTYKHEKRFKMANGMTGQPTEAQYKNVMNPLAGTIIFDEDESPGFAKAVREQINKEPHGGDIPDLTNLSDLAFFQWTEACQEKSVDPGAITQMVWAHVVTPLTFKQVQQSLMEAGLVEFPAWSKKAVFKMDSRPGQAILGTLQGASTALFLIQHKATLGHKKITEVAVWTAFEPVEFDADPEYAYMNMRFKVENA